MQINKRNINLTSTVSTEKETCFKLNALQGYWRCAQILKATKQWGDALEVLFDGLDRCDEMGQDVRVNFVSEILKNLANMPPGGSTVYIPQKLHEHTARWVHCLLPA